MAARKVSGGERVQQIHVRTIYQVRAGDTKPLHQPISNFVPLRFGLSGSQHHLDFQECAQSFDTVEMDACLPHHGQGAALPHHAPDSERCTKDLAKSSRVIHKLPRYPQFLAVNKAIASVPGVEVKSVQIGRADLRVPDSGGTDQAVKAAVERAGYKVEGLITG